MQLGPRHVHLVRSVDAGNLLESFLVAAIVSLLAIRFYLELSGYPQIGGGGLHIAHMLWGGLFMVVALVLLLAFLGKRVARGAAVLGGVGFGTFIDELGKFITSDNNYFFQPTIALIYAIFVALFLIFRAIGRQQQLTPDEYLVNAVDLLKESLLDRNNAEKKDRALLLLEKSRATGSLAEALKGALRQVDSAQAVGQPLTANITRRARGLYATIVKLHWFHRTLVTVFVLYGIAAVLEAILVVITPIMVMSGAVIDLPDLTLSFHGTGELISSIISSALIAIGALRLPRARLSAYYWFKRSILVSIFLDQFFSFYNDQLGALVWLVLDIVFLLGLNYMIRKEQGLAEAERVAHTAPR